MRKTSLTLALVLILALLLPGCAKSPEPPDYATAEFTLASPYLAYIGKTRGEVIEALGITEEEYYFGSEESPNGTRIERREPVLINGLEFTFTLLFEVPPNDETFDLEAYTTDSKEADKLIFSSFGYEYTYVKETSDLAMFADAIEPVYSLLVADHGTPDTKDSWQASSVQAFVDSGSPMNAASLFDGWLISNEFDYATLAWDEEPLYLALWMYTEPNNLAIWYRTVSEQFGRINLD